ncbi:MAG TPA: MMPL family transporter [Candidatus Thalassarchaeaceae archaeon]|nr:MMPL family transporter [Candidatus Thalassarchaeaceae archaeon]|tara:strand:+ start:60923 stop:64189 length:3267 start_codon:yes stop_codon:yes gene_type:complete
MRDFSNLADFLIPRRKKVHVLVVVVTLLMIPGVLATFEPIDIESYEMESPELDANIVLREEFTAAGNIWGFGVFVRDPENFGEADSDISMIAEYPGKNTGLETPVGGILNLTILREIDINAETMRNHEVSEFYLPLASEISGDPSMGMLDLANEFRAFMSGNSSLTQPRINPYKLASTLDIEASTDPAPTNWTDCGQLECLQFDDPLVTQAHIDMAAHRMANNSNGAFLRFLSNDRAFTPDPDSHVIGPLNHQIDPDGSISSDDWVEGRWSASAAWIIVNFNREEMQSNGWTFSWKNASADFGYQLDGVTLTTDPVRNSVEECRERESSGQKLCSVEWVYLVLEEDLRESDEHIVTLMFAESINVEINRELLSSAYLVILMSIVVVLLLWVNLRRISDVAIVSTSLVTSMIWMYGLIGWAIILGRGTGFEIIFRSQFSNLLPILILALEIDDSLHSLHRYKEERRLGKDLEYSTRISISKVGLAIMLTSVTTIIAFMANLSSSIAALRSFGIEAGLGVMCAFFLTGLWVPLLRLDVDIWLQSKGKLVDERDDTIHMIPKSWLSKVTRGSAKFSPLVMVLALLVTVFATPIMLSLEGDFQVEDFVDGQSDLAVGVGLINERFSDEGEPAFILIEGNMTNPRVLDAIEELRENMNSHGPDEPDQISRLPGGDIELLGIDQMLWYARASMAWNQTPFEEAGWNFSSNDGGIGCETILIPNRDRDYIFIPSTNDSKCLQFIYGFIMTRGVPSSGGYPALSTSIVGEFIQVEGNLDYDRPWLTEAGKSPKYPRASLRFGLSSPEQFALVEPALEQLERDMIPLQNLSKSPLRDRAPFSDAFSDEEYPVTWAIPAGEPVVRFVAADSMQDDLQDTILIGVIMCFITLWWGFRTESPLSQRLPLYSSEPKKLAITIALNTIILSSTVYLFLGMKFAIASVFLSVALSFLWGSTAFFFAAVATTPILMMIIWLYAMVGVMGFGLNMVTVSIAAISLGVGIDYVIHLVERFREEIEKGSTTIDSLGVVGSASGLALFGSAISDFAGFWVIKQSEMGFFSTFGLFCAIMIGLSLIASMVIAPAALGLLHRAHNSYLHS